MAAKVNFTFNRTLLFKVNEVFLMEITHRSSPGKKLRSVKIDLITKLSKRVLNVSNIHCN